MNVRIARNISALLDNHGVDYMITPDTVFVVPLGRRVREELEQLLAEYNHEILVVVNATAVEKGYWE
jgi:hypothetical protein